MLGGFSLYSYVSDSNTFVDLFGWEDIWFRALSLDDMASVDSGVGIIPKNPTTKATALEHVLGGSTPGYGDQFISLTKDEKLAQIWATKSNTNVAVIDLDQVSNNKLDLSTGDGRKMHLGDASLGDKNILEANKYARGAKELLVEGQIDQKAIKETYDPKTKLKSKPYP